MNRVRLQTRRIWVAIHSLGLGALAALFIGALRGQQCPGPPPGGNGDWGPFAYGDGAPATTIAGALLSLYALSSLGAIVASVATSTQQAPTRRRTLANLVIVPIVLVWSLFFWFVQADSPTLCDGSSIAWFVVVYIAMTAAVVVGNWPLERQRSTAESDTAERARPG
jgi:hypothetical protein